MNESSHIRVEPPAAPWKTHAQWMETANGRFLHFVAPLTEDEDEHGRACSAPGVPRISLCGIRMRCFIPGLGMRMGGARCERCCNKMNLPWGYGTPANEVARWRKFFEQENECLSPT